MQTGKNAVEYALANERYDISAMIITFDKTVFKDKVTSG